MGFNVTGLADVFVSNYDNSLLGDATIEDPADIFGFGGTPVLLSSLVPQNVLLLKYYLDDDLAARFTLGINSFSQKNVTSDSTFFSTFDENETKLSALSFGIGAGIESHVGSSAKADPYVGAELQIAMLGAIKYTQTFTSTRDDFLQNIDREVQYPGGLGLGLNLLGGFNCFFSDNISVGGEVGIGFNTVRIGGDWTDDSTNSTTSGNTTTTITTNDEGQFKSSSSGIGVSTLAELALLYTGK
jgi:hypothetical protein